MPNITRGGRMRGVVAYLVGPGKQNEHRSPHLVAGDPGLMSGWGQTGLDRRGVAVEIADYLDHPRRTFGTKVTIPVKGSDGHHHGDRRDAHVWHCSLSLQAAEGEISDEQWSAIAEEFASGMGFAGSDTAPQCRWAAIRHGVSSGGNDHVHLVVSMVREDGSTARVNRDRPRAQKLAGELERKHGLAVLESRQAGYGARGVAPAEREISAARGEPELPRDLLERTVRACAAAALDEGEFVRRLRLQGVRVAPRFAVGGSSAVTGYKVALRSRDMPAVQRGAERTAREGEQAWYGGGRLARDLTLPRLRAGWAQSAEQTRAAVLEWTAAADGDRRPPVSPGRETHDVVADSVAPATAEIAELMAQKRAVPPEDRATWAQVAGRAAGVFAAWSVAAEATPGPIAAAAVALSRSAALPAWQARTARPAVAFPRMAPLLIAAAVAPGNKTIGWFALVRQLDLLTRALHDSHIALGDLQRANELQVLHSVQLQALAARFENIEPLDKEALAARQTAAAGQTELREPSTPEPRVAPSEPVRPRAPQTPRAPQKNIER